jgi:2-C-methyl-D-erythritol 4-phosphate cytidylyltransferase
MFGLIPAAGSGSRFGGGQPKQYSLLAGRPILCHTIDALQRGLPLHQLFVVLAADDAAYATCVGDVAGVVTLACGGRTRAETVRNGLAAIAEQVRSDDWIVVHDAVRPCVDAAALARLGHALEHDEVGGLLAMPLADTLKRAAADGSARVAATPSRKDLWCAQTPQMFRYAVLKRALDAADANETTDEARAIEAMGQSPLLVRGSPMNIKITYAEDLALAEAILAARS